MKSRKASLELEVIDHEENENGPIYTELDNVIDDLIEKMDEEENLKKDTVNKQNTESEKLVQSGLKIRDSAMMGMNILGKPSSPNPSSSKLILPPNNFNLTLPPNLVPFNIDSTSLLNIDSQVPFNQNSSSSFSSSSPIVNKRVIKEVYDSSEEHFDLSLYSIWC